MFSTVFIAAAATSLSLISSVVADYDPNSQANVAMYYGSGPGQQNLRHFCDSSSVDIIPIGFINIFPSAANGLVAENFGNQCWAEGNYTGPGYNGAVNPQNDFLYKRCPYLQDDIYYCQTQTKKKILLSLGGETTKYQLNGAAEGQYLADFLWGAYGPYDASWVAKGGVRPLDRGLYNTNQSMTIDIDGFDFDIEHTSADNQAGYIAAIKRLRENFAAYKVKNPCSKDYLISGAPQCPLPEGNMGLTIANAKFDILFIQFYNNGANGCTARNWASSTDKSTSGFNYNKWVSFVNSGASAGAKLYIGLLGSDKAGTASDYIYASEAKPLIQAYHGAAQFGGVMLWEATYAENNNAIRGYDGMNYYQVIKSFLAPYAPAVTATTTACGKTSTTSSMTSTKTSSSTSTQISTTSSWITSTSKTTSSTQGPTSTAIPISTDGRCGDNVNGKTCKGSAFGSCCSVKGNCGTGPAFCAASNLCQPKFGTCTSVSTDGKCGSASSTNAICLGSTFGDCCSVKGNCGKTPAFCAASNLCQPGFGTCTPVSTDGKCGSASSVGATCLGSSFGGCCSVKGNCGSSAAFCAVSNLCQPMFGNCT